MSRLLGLPAYAARDDDLFLAEMNALTAHHAQWCAPFRNMLEAQGREIAVRRIQDIPFTHVSLFKHVDLSSAAPGRQTVRSVLSSATTGASSRVAIDEFSAGLQARSSEAILAEFIGRDRRPVLVLDSVASLRSRHEFSARIMAAMSLKPFASEMFFLLKDAGDVSSLQLHQIECAMKASESLIVYGFSWILWLALAEAKLPEELQSALRQKTVAFVHSGGWKKLEDRKVDRATFEATLLAQVGPGSCVVDYYGLVEQMGVVFPLCDQNSRHVPRWADVIVRDSWTMEPLAEGEGQLQLLNTISHGSPCHSVLTEDMGRLLPGRCGCGRLGRRFELIGRVPKAELRGCANV